MSAVMFNNCTVHSEDSSRPLSKERTVVSFKTEEWQALTEKLGHNLDEPTILNELWVCAMSKKQSDQILAGILK